MACVSPGPAKSPQAPLITELMHNYWKGNEREIFPALGEMTCGQNQLTISIPIQHTWNTATSGWGRIV